MLIGKSVLIYMSETKFSAPFPGIVTGEYEDVAKLVDVETFHRRSSPFSHTVPMERVMLVTTPAEASEAWSKGYKYVACDNPNGLVEEAAPKPAVKAAPKR